MHSKEISYRGGVVVFDIPDDWTEEYEPDGGGTFYLPVADSGTLRLNILTFQTPAQSATKNLAQVLENSRVADPPSIRLLPNGNAYGDSVTRTSEDGQKITVYWWYVINEISPNHLRLANFSYTVLSSQEGSARLQEELAFLRQSIEKARFASVAGE